MRTEPRDVHGHTYTPHLPSVIAADVYEVNACHLPWLLGQDRVWVDYWGHVHDLDLMPRDYLLNVFGLIRRYAAKRRDEGPTTSEVLTSPLVERLHDKLTVQTVLQPVTLSMPITVVTTAGDELDPADLPPGDYVAYPGFVSVQPPHGGYPTPISANDG